MREESKLRKQDEKTADIVADFLDKTFYKEETNDFIRNVEKTLQVYGIDTIFTYKGKKYKCDEKTTAHYGNLKTLALELSFINKNGDVTKGWLLNENLLNNSYLFAWLDNDKVEISLVEKATLLEYIESLGWTRQLLFKKQEKIRNSFDNFQTENLDDLDEYGIKFHYSRQLVEKPINILLPRKKYAELSVFNKIYPTKKWKKTN